MFPNPSQACLDSFFFFDLAIFGLHFLLARTITKHAGVFTHLRPASRTLPLRRAKEVMIMWNMRMYV